MEWETLRSLHQQASTEFVRGNSAPLLELYSSSDPMHICGAFGGYETGAEKVRARVQWAGEQYRDGHYTEELIDQWLGTDSAVTLTLETIEATIGGQTNRRQELRVTLVYRREHDGWKIAHRHADFLRPTSTENPFPATNPTPG